VSFGRGGFFLRRRRFAGSVGAGSFGAPRCSRRLARFAFCAAGGAPLQAGRPALLAQRFSLELAFRSFLGALLRLRGVCDRRGRLGRGCRGRGGDGAQRKRQQNAAETAGRPGRDEGFGGHCAPCD
jgi:hypothetical protein